MAKTLNQFIEGYLKVKSADEQKFIDKHVTAKNPDRNGNGDDVFKGSTKTIDRRKDRKGYNPGEDEKVYEALKGNQHKIDANKNGKVDAHDFHLLRKKKKVAEEAEQIDELSNQTTGSYIAKAAKSLDRNSMVGGMSIGSRSEKADKVAAKRLKGLEMVGKKIRREEVEELDELSKKTLKNYIVKASSPKQHFSSKGSQRDKNIPKAVNKLAKEEVELDEKLNMDKASMGTVVKDFQKSDAPQFKGKSVKKRQVMAIAAKLSAERGGKPLNKEERLQDRLSDVSESHQRVMLEVFEKLNEDNKTKFMTACSTPEGVEQMLDFAITYRGE